MKEFITHEQKYGYERAGDGTYHVNDGWAVGITTKTKEQAILICEAFNVKEGTNCTPMELDRQIRTLRNHLDVSKAAWLSTDKKLKELTEEHSTLAEENKLLQSKLDKEITDHKYSIGLVEKNSNKVGALLFERFELQEKLHKAQERVKLAEGLLKQCIDLFAQFSDIYNAAHERAAIETITKFLNNES